MYSLKAVLTVEYGKELRASLEVGDALFPYDNIVKVGVSKYGGVLLLYTSLSYEDILKILKSTPTTYVKSIAKVDICCPETFEELSKCINEYLTQTNLKVGTVKIYERGSIKKYSKKLLDSLRSILDTKSNLKLYISPVDYRICVGIHEV